MSKAVYLRIQQIAPSGLSNAISWSEDAEWPILQAGKLLGDGFHGHIAGTGDQHTGASRYFGVQNVEDRRGLASTGWSLDLLQSKLEALNGSTLGRIHILLWLHNLLFSCRRALPPSLLLLRRRCGATASAACNGRTAAATAAEALQLVFTGLHNLMYHFALELRDQLAGDALIIFRLHGIQNRLDVVR
eukprot:s762_g3.t1